MKRCRQDYIHIIIMSHYRNNRPFNHEADGADPSSSVFITSTGMWKNALALSLRRILTQYSFELEIAEDPADVEVLDFLRQDFLLRADHYTDTQGILPFAVTFDSDLLVPYDEMLPRGMSEANANLDRDSSLRIIITAPSHIGGV